MFFKEQFDSIFIYQSKQMHEKKVNSERTNKNVKLFRMLSISPQKKQPESNDEYNPQTVVSSKIFLPKYVKNIESNEKLKKKKELLNQKKIFLKAHRNKMLENQSLFNISSNIKIFQQQNPNRSKNSLQQINRTSQFADGQIIGIHDTSTLQFESKKTLGHYSHYSAILKNKKNKQYLNGTPFDKQLFKIMPRRVVTEGDDSFKNKFCLQKCLSRKNTMEKSDIQQNYVKFKSLHWRINQIKKIIGINQKKNSIFRNCSVSHPSIHKLRRNHQLKSLNKTDIKIDGGSFSRQQINF